MEKWPGGNSSRIRTVKSTDLNNDRGKKIHKFPSGKGELNIGTIIDTHHLQRYTQPGEKNKNLWV